MKKPLTCQILLFVVATFLAQCKDDDTVAPVAVAGCVIQEETTNLIMNEASWSYEYTKEGLPLKITRRNIIGDVTDVIEASGYHVDKTRFSPGGPSDFRFSIRYEGYYMTSKPTRGFVSVTHDHVTTVNYEIYLFGYDSKGRLSVITQQTPNVTTDLEWELSIFYNDDDNVVKLFYEFLTGPRAESTTIEVDSFDNHPTPHSGVPGWKFLMYNYTWNNYDPGPVIAALSKNNALHLTFYANAVEQFETTSSYEYNDKGFPLTRTNTNKNENGESTNIQTYSYKCP